MTPPDYTTCPACDHLFHVEQSDISGDWFVCCPYGPCPSDCADIGIIAWSADVARQLLVERIEDELGEMREREEKVFLAENPPQPEREDKVRWAHKYDACPLDPGDRDSCGGKI